MVESGYGVLISCIVFVECDQRNMSSMEQEEQIWHRFKATWNQILGFMPMSSYYSELKLWELKIGKLPNKT